MLQFFGLHEHPFGVTPDPHFLYMTPGHREALASLRYGVELKRGFMSLIAPPGLGKTTLLLRLFDELRDQAETAFIFNTQCSSNELMGHLFSELGINCHHGDRVQAHNIFNSFLLQQSRRQRDVVVVIDEAQNLGETLLETVRLLSNFETPRTKLLQVILAGQPQLDELLSRRSMIQLRQRISLMARLRPLTVLESSEYIAHRLSVAGYQGPGLFTPRAERLLIDLSEGIPRTLNNLCFHSLSMAYAAGTPVVDSATVREIADDLQLHSNATETGWQDLPDNIEEQLPAIVPACTSAEVTLGSGSTNRSHRDAEIISGPAPVEPKQKGLARAQQAPPPESQPTTEPSCTDDPSVDVASLVPSPEPRIVEGERCIYSQPPKSFLFSLRNILSIWLMSAIELVLGTSEAALASRVVTRVAHGKATGVPSPAKRQLVG